MKVSRQIILTILMLGSIAGTASAMFPKYTQKYPQYNMGNMFGQQPRMQQQRRHMPQMGQQFANPMMYSMMMNQLNNTQQSAGSQALSAFMNWTMTGQPYYLQSAIRNTVQSVTNTYYPQKLKNIWWTRVIINTVLSRLTNKAVAKAMIWFTSQQEEQAE